MSQSQKEVFAELSEDGKHIEVYFTPSPKWLDIMHGINAKFIGRDKLTDGQKPHWVVAVDYFAARNLSAAVGKDNLELGDALKAWAWEQKETEQGVDSILKAEGDAKLVRLPEVLPALADAIHVGPKGKNMTPAEFKQALKGPASYQATDVQYMSFVGSPLNANQPGLGKTLELIAAVYEAGLEDGAHLVVAPVTSLDSVWETELKHWQGIPVFRAAGEGLSRRDRIDAMRNAELSWRMGKPFWLLVNPEMVRLKKKDKLQGIRQENLYADWPWLGEAEWATVTLDECHKNAVRNLQTVTAQGLLRLNADKKFALSGTPMGGKPINLFGILHWLHPDKFPSKYKFAAEWLQTEEVVHSKRTKETHTEIGDVREDRIEEWDRMMAPLMIRRTKAECITWLPAKQYVDVWCSMTETQAEQYVKFAKMAEIELGDQTLTATNVLAIYSRLKQFASATQRFEDGSLIPTEDSGKVHALLEKLDELGILDGESDAQAVVGSQFSRMVDMVYDVLTARGVPCVKITGQVAKRADAIKSFQEDKKARVIVMSTDAGGVSITLDNADTVHVLDEKWNPDDQEQLEDRVHRASRIHQVTCYYYRSTGTVEQYIKEVTGKKGRLNKRVLDERRIRLY